MEKVLYLESDEEITSVLERIKEIKTKNVGLVVPRDALLLQSLVNLKLLKKESQKLSKNLLIVCPDKAGQRLAEKAGLKVSASIDEGLLRADEEELSEESEEDKDIAPAVPKPEVKQPEKFKAAEIKPDEPKKPLEPPKTKRSFKINKKMLIFGGIFTLFVITFIVFLFLPKAKVNLVIKSEKFSDQFDITVDKNIVSADVENNTIPAELLETTIEESENLSATGEKEIGEKAKGTITIYNLYDSSSQSLPAGTKVAKDGKTFLITQAVTVPGVTRQAGQDVAGTATASVEAQNEGSDYNISAGKFSISGYPSSLFYGQSSKAMAGGYSKVIKVVSQKDATGAQNSIKEKIQKKALEELQNKSSDDFELLEDSIEVEILDFATNPAVDSEADQFSATLKTKAKAIIYKKSEMENIVLENFTKSIQEKEKEIVFVDQEKLEKSIKDLDLEKGTITISVSGDAESAPKLDQEKLISALVGKTGMEAEDYLTGFREIESADVNLWPFWVKKVPSLNESMKINIEYTTSPPTENQNNEE